MLFTSSNFLIFFPIVAIFYFAIPHKFRWLWLLFASYFFYMSWNPLYGILLFLVTVISWFSALLMGRGSSRAARKWILVCGVLLALSFLIYFKYSAFFLDSLAVLLQRMGLEPAIPAVDVIVPVGLSFYSFQALGYVIDVYRGDVRAEKNLARHALFVSFFPQLLAGPIGRAKTLAPDLAARHDFDYQKARQGLLLMLWGYFLKMIIADHAAPLVAAVYDDFYYVAGYQVVVATLLFAIQIYCDFAAYSALAIGAARIMGISLGENFRQPYLAASVKEFWRRWHISLSTWFRDYLYIPLGGSRVSRLKKYRNIMITFLLSGLWHGASFNFLAWGALHGLYLIGEDFVAPGPQTGFRRALRTALAFILVSFAWIFFRANGLKAAMHMIGRMFTNPMSSGMGSINFIQPIMLLGIVILVFADIYAQKHDISHLIFKQKLVIRWAFYIAAVFFILPFGVYGVDYAQGQFIYFEF